MIQYLTCMLPSSCVAAHSKQESYHGLTACALAALVPGLPDTDTNTSNALEDNRLLLFFMMTGSPCRTHER